jgi:hypothetical protein
MATRTRRNGNALAPSENVSVLESPEASVEQRKVIIRVPRLDEAVGHFRLTGTTPYMQLRFSEKSRQKMQATQEAGQQARSRRTRTPRDFDDDYRQSMHLFADGSYGVPCTAFRNALISTCRLVGFKMTIAKLCIFVEMDGEDVVDHTPLVRLEGEPDNAIMPVRNATGVADLRARARWETWVVPQLRIRWDIDQFSVDDMHNLLHRAGRQVGIGEGRPDGREGNGIGYGLFNIEMVAIGT